jgi:elongation factor P--(R)-beta-lysine ligase
MRLRYQFELIQLIRNFFGQQGFLDVITPPMVENPGMEVHIHPFAVHSTKSQKVPIKYLHTSPEFALKELLASSEEAIDKLFSITYCFRDEPDSAIHRSQFIMLEWYRKHARYEVLMQDTEELIRYCLNSEVLPIKKDLRQQTIQRLTMQELFQKILNIDILNYLDVPSIQSLLKKFPDVPVPATELDWDDYFFLLYLNKIEPEIMKIPLLMIYEFPAPLAALSTIKVDDPRVCERFEVYVNGIELCNCFNELTDASEQRNRFASQNLAKKRLYGYDLPEPKAFYKALEGGLPPSAGIALGVERLLLSLCDITNPFFR